MTAKADTHNTLFVVSINRLCYHWHGWNKMRPQSWRDTCCRLVGRWTTFTKGYLALLPCSSTARTGGRKWCKWNELIDLFQLGANCPDCWHEKKSGKEGGREEHGNSECEQTYYKNRGSTCHQGPLNEKHWTPCWWSIRPTSQSGYRLRIFSNAKFSNIQDESSSPRFLRSISLFNLLSK